MRCQPARVHAHRNAHLGCLAVKKFSSRQRPYGGGGGVWEIYSSMCHSFNVPTLLGFQLAMNLALPGAEGQDRLEGGWWWALEAVRA